MRVQRAVPRLPPPSDAVWRDGALVSTRCDDVYFSRGGGLEETALVFHAGCGLPERWRGRSRFAILELGFGTGLNALATWALWAETRDPGAVLHFVTTENQLLERGNAARALAAFPSLAGRAQALVARWPRRAAGPQRLWFDADGFALTVLVGEAAHSLAGLRGRFDAMFLDGFAPARNPDMWSAAIFERLAALAAPGARAATYSVAGAVRRGLEAVGFAVEKKAGFGAKRERVEARFEGPPRNDPYPLLPYDPIATPPARVAVVGGGIAGAAVAHAFTRRGVAVTLCECAPRLGSGASGNPAGLVMPRLDRDDGPVARFFRAAHLHALDAYRGGFVAMDVIESARSARDVIAIEDLARDPPFADDLLGFAPGALVHRGAGLLRPGEWIARWTQGADVRLGADVQGVACDGAGWRLALEDCAIEADAVVIAAGPNLAAFADLPIARRAGQIEWADAPVSGPVRTAGAYAAPFDGGLLFGATFDATEADEVAVSPEAQARNLASLAALAPDWAEAAQGAPIRSRASVRATTPDRAPIAGLALDTPAWRARFAGLAKGAAVDRTTPAPHLAGLYLIGGLGARGLSLAPLLAECVASACCGEPAPFDKDVLDAIHPGRFALRGLRRGQI